MLPSSPGAPGGPLRPGIPCEVQSSRRAQKRQRLLTGNFDRQGIQESFAISILIVIVRLL